MEARGPLPAGQDCVRDLSGWLCVFVAQDFPSVVVVGLGKKAAGVDEQENWHEGKENIRVAVAGYLTFDVYIEGDS